MLISLTDARKIIDAAPVPRGTVESVAVRDALGRLAGATIRARSGVPARALSAMDGFALRVAGRPTAGPFTIRGAVYPSSRPRARPLGHGEATYVTTGAPLPSGANAVVRVEATSWSGHRLLLRHPAHKGQDILPTGESVARGDLLVARGEPVRAAQIGALLAQRIHRVSVFRLRVTVVPIGDELVPAGTDARRGTWDYMGPTIAGLLPFAEVRLRAPIPDDPRSVGRELRDSARRSDLVITIGGSSVGERDVTKNALRSVGRLWFDGVRANVLKRGAVGAVGSVPVVVLPGQLVSAVTVFHEHGLHVISRMVGRELRRFERVTIRRGLHVGHRLDSTYLFRVDEGGATPLPWGVARMTALLEADGFGILTRGRTYRAGDRIELLRMGSVA